MKKRMMMLGVLAGLSMSASAALVTEYSFGTTAGKAADAVNLGAAVAADVGDVIVFAASSSKAYVKSYSVTSGDAGTVGVQSGVWEDKNVSVSYFTVMTGGTFDLSVAGYDQTFDSFNAYVIGSDQVGYSVAEIGTASMYMTNHTAITLNQLDYGTLASGGMVVEAVQANLVTTYPTGYDVFANVADSRASATGSFSAGAVVSDYIIGGDTSKNSRTAGIAFAEVIPEPATLGLIASAGGILLFMRRRFMI